MFVAVTHAQGRIQRWGRGGSRPPYRRRSHIAPLEPPLKVSAKFAVFHHDFTVEEGLRSEVEDDLRDLGRPGVSSSTNLILVAKAH